MLSKINVQTELTDNGCTGCGLCTMVCPTGAVKLSLNKKMATVREVDNNKCVSCNKCVKYCSQIIDYELNKPKTCYAAFPVLEQRKAIYSSGGAASLISMKFMEKYKGVVCGCTWDKEKRCAKHVVITKKEQLGELCGSKYVQSDILSIFEEIKQYVDCKTNVLFIGTPCQVDAILRYCKSEYLYTVDLICHGTPPTSYLEDYIKSLPNCDSIKDIRFRGEQDFWFTAKNSDNVEVYRAYKDCDPYFHAFLKGTIYRENCYECKYAQIKRVADITLGDFWELDRGALMYSGNISLILENTLKGEELINEASDLMIIQKRDIEEAIKGNLQLQSPMEKTAEQREFGELLEEYSNFMSAFKKSSVYKEAIANKKRMARNMKKHKMKIFLQSIRIMRDNDKV